METKGYSKLFAFGGRTDGLSLDVFRAGFDLNDFLSALCNEATIEKEEEDITTPSAEAAVDRATATNQKIQRVLEYFRKTESRLRLLHQSVTQQLTESQMKLEAEQEQYKDVVEVIDRQFADLRKDFSVVDTKIAGFGQVGSRIGERLKRLFERKSRAENALELIKYLEDFSGIKGKRTRHIMTHALKRKYDAQLPQAAEIAQKLTLLSKELLSAKTRLDEAVDETSLSGTLETSIAALQEYCSDLENRLVSRFDLCMNASDLKGMKQCAEIMAKLDKEMILAQRYICSRPMFIDLKEVQLNQNQSLAVMDLQTMYREILHTVKHEAQVIETVFPSSHEAMDLFLQRLMEQRVRSALDVILVEPDRGAEPEEIRDFIRLVAQVYEKTHTLAINLERVTADDLELVDFCDALVCDYIINYPEIEMEWLEQMYQKQESFNSDGSLDVNTIVILSEWNKEAVQRCKALSPQNMIAQRVRQLFHSSTYHRANPGCLLEQTARHIMKGLRVSIERCEAGSSSIITSHSLSEFSTKTIAGAAQKLVGNGIGHMFVAVNQTTQMIDYLQSHFRANVDSHVSSSVAESAACMSGLSALIRAIEEKVLEGLNTAVRAFFNQIEKILIAEQKRHEYRPGAGATIVFDRPTVACQMICELLEAMRESATRNIKRPNLASFLEEAGYEASACLSVHIARFTFSPAGALRLKRDMADYIETVRKFESIETLSQFETLQQLVNIFIVAPESLIGLVDGSLRMSHKDALKYIQLREDFKTAKVDGHTLAQLFASEMNEFD